MSTATGVGVTIYTRRDDTRGERGLGFYKGRRPKQVRRYHTPSGLIGLRACWLVCGRLQGKLLVGWVLHLVAAVRTLRLVGFPCLQEGLFGLIYFCVCTMKPNCVVFVSGGAVVGTLRERLSREGPSANGRGEGFSVLFARLDLLVGWCRHELITELPSDQTIARVPSVLRGHQQRLFPDPRRSRSSFFFFFFCCVRLARKKQQPRVRGGAFQATPIPAGREDIQQAARPVVDNCWDRGRVPHGFHSSVVGRRPGQSVSYMVQHCSSSSTYSQLPARAVLCNRTYAVLVPIRTTSTAFTAKLCICIILLYCSCA